MSFPFALVVTTSCEPSGVNATCPGVWVNCGGRARVEAEGTIRAEDGHHEAEHDPVALHRPSVLGVEHVDEITVHSHAHRDAPPEGSTSCRLRLSLWVRKTEMVLLPALTAKSRLLSAE